MNSSLSTYSGKKKCLVHRLVVKVLQATLLISCLIFFPENTQGDKRKLSLEDVEGEEKCRIQNVASSHQNGLNPVKRMRKQQEWEQLEEIERQFSTVCTGTNTLTMQWSNTSASQKVGNQLFWDFMSFYGEVYNFGIKLELLRLRVLAGVESTNPNELVDHCII